MYTTSVLN